MAWEEELIPPEFLFQESKGGSSTRGRTIEGGQRGQDWDVQVKLKSKQKR